MQIGKPHTGAFIRSTHYFALRVYMEDTDLGGVVYHANYLRFLERARSDLLRAVGIDQRAAIESGQGVYAVAELRIKYCRPAKLDDELVVATDVVDVRGASAVVRQRVLRGDETLADAAVTLAFVGSTGRPKRQPAEWVQRFRQVTELAPAGQLPAQSN
jgi:acyl-CoA thioester hydrolase